ncbi:hypothetical protein OJE16_12620 [Pantoea tagorei]
MKRSLITALALGALCLSPALWAATCGPHSKAVASSNSWIMLGGSAKGAVRQVIAGEFGKDVDSQKRVLGQFDPCGILLVADVSFDKKRAQRRSQHGAAYCAGAGRLGGGVRVPGEGAERGQRAGDR